VRVFDRLKDATVLGSFDRSGFVRHARRFDPTDLDVDLCGRVVLVTGASGGLGQATATALARLGATVWVNSRSRERAETACAAIRAVHPAARVVPMPFDVSSIAAVRAWADALTGETLDVLIHNAGVLPATRTTTEEGHEQTVATNLIGPFALTAALLPRLARSPDPRIVWVSSGGMLTQKLDVEATFDPPEPFDGVVAYARTKRAEVVVAERMAAELGPRCTVASMHPGWAATPGVQTSLPGFFRWMQSRLRSPEQGADTTVWLAARRPAPSPSGAFWFDRTVASTHPVPGTRTPPAEAERLWSRLVDLVGGFSVR
jgi:dehydrogenase/reductase SDR family protein 12